MESSLSDYDEFVWTPVFRLSAAAHVAERKVRSLLQAGAMVTIVSPEFTEGLWRWRASI